MPKKEPDPPFKPPKNEQHRKFCHEYRKDRHITRAAKRACYSETSAHTIGWRLLQRDEIKAYIEYLDKEESAKADISREDLINLCKEVIDADLQDYVDDDGAITFNEDSPNHRAVASLKVTQGVDGSKITEIKLREPSQYQERVAKLLGLDKPPPPEKKEITFRIVRGDKEEVVNERD